MFIIWKTLLPFDIIILNQVTHEGPTKVDVTSWSKVFQLSNSLNNSCKMLKLVLANSIQIEKPTAVEYEHLHHNYFGYVPF